MRTIKFRGKCCHSDAWAFGNLVDYGEDENPEIHGFDVFREGFDVFGEERGGWREPTVERDTIGQFTGLYDKNGKEIYEGDIVKVTNLLLEGFGQKMLAHIVYDEDLVCFNFKALDRERCMAASIPDVIIEVIGNIHDNPELLEH